MELSSAPPPERHIIIVGFLPDNNGRSCALHPFGCGNIVVLERADGGVGMLVRLRMHEFVDGALERWAMRGEIGPS